MPMRPLPGPITRLPLLSTTMMDRAIIPAADITHPADITGLNILALIPGITMGRVTTAPRRVITMAVAAEKTV